MVSPAFDPLAVTQAKALWYVAPGAAELRAETLSAPDAGQVRVRSLWFLRAKFLRPNSPGCGHLLWVAPFLFLSNMGMPR